MRRIAAAALGLALIAGCGEEPPAAPKVDKRVELGRSRNESANLMSMMNGAVVVDRSGEKELGNAALLAIDSTLSTIWIAAPGLNTDWMVTELPALCEVQRIVLSPGEARPSQQAKKVQVESSEDGSRFTPLATLTLGGKSETQPFDVRRTTARFIRVRLLEAFDGKFAPAIASVALEGRELEPRRQVDVTGVWRFNQYDAELAQIGTRLFGVVKLDPPMIIAGDLVNGYGRFLWVRENEAGYGVLSANPGGDRLNAIWWHERPLLLFFGESWYGSRAQKASAREAEADPAMIATSLRQLGLFSMYGLRFEGGEQKLAEGDGTLRNALAVVRSAPARQFKMVAYGWGHGDDAQNLKIAQARIAALRAAVGAPPANLAFEARGAAAPPRCDPPRTPQIVTLYDRIDLELSVSRGNHEPSGSTHRPSNPE